MAFALRIVIGLVALLLLVMGLNLMFNPEGAAAGYGLTPDGVIGLNSLRGDLGGLFLASTALLVIGLVSQRAEWFFAVAVVIGLIAFGRLVGFVMDGTPASTSLTAFTVELVIVLLMFAASRMIVGPRAAQR
jgi:hypothetical protein